MFIIPAALPLRAHMYSYQVNRWFEVYIWAAKYNVSHFLPSRNILLWNAIYLSLQGRAGYKWMLNLNQRTCLSLRSLLPIRISRFNFSIRIWNWFLKILEQRKRWKISLGYQGNKDKLQETLGYQSDNGC